MTKRQQIEAAFKTLERQYIGRADVARLMVQRPNPKAKVN